MEDPASGVALFAGGVSIGFEDLVDPRLDGLDFRFPTNGCFPGCWNGASDRIANHSPVYAKLSGHASHCPYSMLKLPSQLFE
jgi:hypothetical protein